MKPREFVEICRMILYMILYKILKCLRVVD